MIFEDPLALMHFARAHSPFYAELYAGLPERPRWDELPLVEPERYWARKAEAADAVQTGVAQASWMWTTGGSTSRSKRVVVSAEDFGEEVRAFRHAFERAGIEAGDRVANLTWAGELSASFILTGAILQDMPVLQLPILGMGESERVLELCRELRPTVLLTFPFVAARLAERLRERAEVLPIAKLLYAGERLHADQRALMRERFCCEHIACFGYGAVDCGPIASAGPERGEAGPTLAPLPDYAVVEIVDERGQPAARGALGRVVVTNLGRSLSPVVRFPVGDLGRWIEAPHIDERGQPRGGVFELESRAHLSVKLGFWIVAHADVTADVRAVGGLHEAVQLLRQRRAGVEWLVVCVAPARDEAPGATSARLCELRERLRARYPKLGNPPGHAGAPVLVVEQRSLAQMQVSSAGKIRPIVVEEEQT